MNCNLSNIGIFSESIEVAGFKGNIVNISKTLEAIDNIKNKCCDGCIIQLIDADAIAGIRHLEHGIIHGMNAFKKGENLANDLGIEICLRLSAQRQISKSLEILGLKLGEMNICAILINCPDYFIDELSLLFNRDDDVLESNPLILKDLYNISEKELAIIKISDILIDRTTELIVEV
jgi:KEOPS complex subunit Cgi121